MPPGDRPGFVDLDRVAEAPEVIGGRQPARPCPHDQHSFCARRRFDAVCPVLLRSEIAEKALDGVNAHRAHRGRRDYRHFSQGW